MIETPTLESFYSVQITLLTQVMKPNISNVYCTFECN